MPLSRPSLFSNTQRMQVRRLLAILFCSVFCFTLVLGMSSNPKEAEPSSAASATVLLGPSEGITPVDPVPEKISAAEVRKIRRSFLDVLEEERDSLRRDQRRSLREGDAGRKARKSEWLTFETSSRRQFFQDNVHGPERRNYVHDFNERRKNFFKILKNEEQVQKSEIDARWKSLEQSQRMLLNRVESYLKQSEHPPAHLLQGN